MFSLIKRLLKVNRVKQNSEIPFNSLSFTEESKEDFNKFVYKWNVTFPIDKWYRDKYKIRFNSEQHRDITFLDMLFEFEEEKIYDDLYKPDTYIPSKGKFLKKKKDKENVTLEDVQKEFDSIDLSQFDD